MGVLPTRILIAVQRPGLWLLGLLVILLVIITLIWSAYLYGQRGAGFDRSQAMKTVTELSQKLEDLQKQYAENQHQAAMIERTSQIDDDASKQLKKSLNDSQQQVMDLKKELAFYKSVVTPDQGKRSLAIQTIQLQRDETGVYRYKVMVSQRGRNDKLVRGSIDIKIEGTEGGKAKVLRLSDVSESAKNVTKFGFKFFQNFEGTMNLPTTFTPENLRVVVTPSSYGVAKIDDLYSWADLSSGGN
jgi:ABC-type Na+ efflux pump permease subunit